MPEISRFYGIKIKMYFNDHAPPHFHAEYQGKIGKYEIDPVRLLEGKIPPTAHKLVLQWAKLYKKELITNWKLSKRKQS